MSWINLGCGTHRAPAPWVNTDTRRDGDTQPDVLVPVGNPFPADEFPPKSVERMLLSHVLEHMTLDQLPAFFSDVRAVLAPGAEVLVLGPDVDRTLELWRQGAEPLNLLRSTMEHADYPGTTDWPEATHWWNCSERRVVDILKFEGFTVEPLECPPADWPSWNWSGWQLCVRARLETT